MSSQYNSPAKAILSKPELRAKMRLVRRQLPVEYRQEQSHLLARQLEPLLNSIAPQTIGMYLATAQEVNLDSVIETFHQKGTAIYLPHLEDGQTPFHRFVSWESLENGPLDLRHPVISAPSIETALLDVIVLPGLAFDRQGNRLGHGGGWYDKAIGNIETSARKPILIGVCFREQMVENVPHEAFDVRMNFIVTPLAVNNVQ